MRLACPVNLEPQCGGTVLASFPDVPEALTEGETEQEAVTEARDCPVAALGGYVELRRSIPKPSPARGRPSVAPPALAALRLLGERLLATTRAV